MKKSTLLYLLAFCFPQAIMAQDLLITEDGDVITAWEVEIASSKIFYKPTKDSEDSKSIVKSKVLMWKKADGTKVRIDATQGDVASEPKQNSPSTTSTLGVISDEMKNMNATMVKDFNKHIKIKDNSTDSKSGTHLYNFWAKDGTIIENNEIRVVPHFVCCHSKTVNRGDFAVASTSPQYDPGTNLPSTFIGKGWQVTIYNKTDHNLYIDQANSFFVLNGQAMSYYVPKSTGQGNSSSIGVGLGIGGIGIGASSGSTTTETTFSQRILIVPPMSNKDLDVIYFDNEHLKILYTPLFTYLVEQKNMQIKLANATAIYLNIPAGMIIETTNPSPVTLGNVITYSDTEDFKAKGTVTQNYELGECAGLDTKEHSKREPTLFNSEELQLPLTLGTNNHCFCVENFLKNLKKKIKEKK